MKKIICACWALPLVTFLSCISEERISARQGYFPPNSDSWETTTPASLQWNETALANLKNFLSDTNTKSFMVLVGGRIAVEEYFNGHSQDATWPWNSAGKTLVTAITGIAQDEGILDLNAPVSDYLGEGWTSAPLEKEVLITPKHLLTMTSGLSDAQQLLTPQNLTYMADAGTRWSYHNVFQRLMDVVTQASGQSFGQFFNARLKTKIGMTGAWYNGPVFRVYHSDTRSAARFGLLALNRGKWHNDQIVSASFFEESVTTSQLLNKSYGYLWWLNGQDSYRLPGSQMLFNGSLIPDAPVEMFAAMGLGEQRIYVVPSRNMVVVRMGESASSNGESFAASEYDNELWLRINAVISQ